LTEIAWTIFSATDVVVLSLFCNLKLVSVYSVYNIVFLSLAALINTMYISTHYVLGHEYNRDRNRYIYVHDGFEAVFISLVFATMTVCYWLIIPFVQLYTDGVTDVNYTDVYLPVLFCLVQMLSWGRYIAGNLAGLANHAKEMSRVSLVETLINITLSLALVHSFGMHGVLIATIVALVFKSIYVIWFANRKILNRSCFQTFKNLGINYLLFIIVGLIGSKFIMLTISTYTDFFMKAIIISLIIYPLYILILFLFNHKILKEVIPDGIGQSIKRRLVK
jgi:O-antigen/teichoic acid export membrane protein